MKQGRAQQQPGGGAGPRMLILFDLNGILICLVKCCRT